MLLEKNYLLEISTLRGGNNFDKFEDFYLKLVSEIYKKYRKAHAHKHIDRQKNK